MRLTFNLRKKVILGLAATLILSASFSRSTSFSLAQSVNRADVGNVASQQKYHATIEMLDRFVRPEMEDKQLPGIAVALVDGSNVVWQQCYGFADPKVKTPINPGTVFRVGSVSKLFTDIAVMREVERGRIDLQHTKSRPILRSLT